MRYYHRGLVGWLEQKDIVGLLFGPTMHAELLKRCTDILRLMSSEQKLTCEHLDTIWNAVQVRALRFVACAIASVSYILLEL